MTRTPSAVVALEGVVLSIDAGNGRFVIQTGGSPVTIQTNTATEFRKGDALATFGDIAVGGDGDEAVAVAVLAAPLRGLFRRVVFSPR